MILSLKIRGNKLQQIYLNLKDLLLEPEGVAIFFEF